MKIVAIFVIFTFVTTRVNSFSAPFSSDVGRASHFLENSVIKSEQTIKNITARAVRNVIPCKCDSQTCSCCTRIDINQLNFDKKVCTNFKYQPKKLSVEFSLTLDQKVLLQRLISAANLPLCVPVPMIPGLTLCSIIYDINFENNKSHFCLRLLVKFTEITLLNLNFNCLEFSIHSGLQLARPNPTESSQKPLLPVTTSPKIPNPGDLVDIHIPDINKLVDISTPNVNKLVDISTPNINNLVDISTPGIKVITEE